jgi:hypothetical protein
MKGVSFNEIVLWLLFEAVDLFDQKIVANVDQGIVALMYPI